MNLQNVSRRWVLLVMMILSLALMPERMLAAGGYVQHNLVSDVPLLADFTDPNLVNPWGIAISATSPFWLCDNRTGLSTVYSTSGGTFAVTTTVVTIPPPASRTSPGGTCTGIVAGDASGFPVTAGNPAFFIFATQDGTISGWNPTANRNQAIIKVDNSTAGAVYDGLAIGTNASGTFLYAANFHAGTIDVFDSNFAKATLAGSFTDPSVAAGFAPFNIQNLGGKLYVTYALQDAAKINDVAGVGNGYVAVFDTNGNLLTHLISNGPLNSPWGVQIAPASFGAFANALLVGNFRDGLIHAFDAATGNLLGTLQDPSGNAILNVGLWALQFGNGGSGGLPTTLYFSAGVSAGSGIQSHGLFGSISVATNVGAAPVINSNGIVNNASYAAGTNALAPGSIAALFGNNLTDGTSCLPPSCNPTFRSDKRLNATMAGAQVTINGIPVPIFYASPTQLGIQIPTDLTGTSATVQVIVNGQSSNTQAISIGPFSPGIFSFTADGKGAGAITHADGTPVNASSPATPGETVIVYATGLGQVTPAVPTGELTSGTAATVTAANITIDGVPATPQFSGLSGCCVGLNQINVVVPSNVRAANNLAVVLNIGGQQSNTVTVAAAAGSAPPPSPPPAAVTISSLTLSSTSVIGDGSSYQGNVILSAAPSSATSVSLSSSNPSVVSVPASVTVAAGSTSATFTLTTVPVTASATVTITASAGGATRTATLTVTPPTPGSPPYNYGY